MSADREQALRWLELADQDLVLAKQALELEPPVLGGSLFHSQQAAEKALKALISDTGTVAPRTHDLAVLWDLAAGAVLGDPPAELQRVSDYAVEPRYPSLEEEYTTQDAEEAKAVAEEVVRRVREVLDEC